MSHFIGFFNTIITQLIILLWKKKIDKGKKLKKKSKKKKKKSKKSHKKKHKKSKKHKKKKKSSKKKKKSSKKKVSLYIVVVLEVPMRLTFSSMTTEAQEA